MSPLTPPRNCTFQISDWEVLTKYWHAVAISSEVADKPVSVRLLDQEIVLFRTSQGVTAAADVCAHRGAPLSIGRMEGDSIICAYHGYCYDFQGRCISVPAHPNAPIPSKLTLKRFRAEERYGLIWVCLDASSVEVIPVFPEYDQPEMQRIPVYSMDWNASAGRQMESFCDVAHFAFVHQATFGVSDPVVPQYEVKATKGGVHAEFESVVAGDAAAVAAKKGDDKWLRVYNISVPFTAHLVTHFPHGGKMVILNCGCPVSARKTRLFASVTRDFDKDTSIEDMLTYHRQIYNEDRFIVERQNPEDLPIDLNEEVHVRADMTSISYRKQLAAAGLGRTFTS